MVTSRILFTAKQKDELWERWKNGQRARSPGRWKGGTRPAYVAAAGGHAGSFGEVGGFFVWKRLCSGFWWSGANATTCTSATASPAIRGLPVKSLYRYQLLISKP